jgi:hypothetical protein
MKCSFSDGVVMRGVEKEGKGRKRTDSRGATAF